MVGAGAAAQMEEKVEAEAGAGASPRAGASLTTFGLVPPLRVRQLPPLLSHQPRSECHRLVRAKEQAKERAGKGKKGEGKGDCYFFLESGTCPRTNCPFAHSR